MVFLFKWVIFRFHVRFPGCTPPKNERMSPFQRKPFRKRRWIIHPSFFRGKLAVRFRVSSWLSMPSMHIGASLNWHFRPRMWTLERGLSSNKKARVSLSLSCGCVKFWCLRFLLLEVHMKFQFQKIVSRIFKVSLLFFAGCLKKQQIWSLKTPSILRYQNQYYGGYPYSQDQIQVYRLSRGVVIFKRIFLGAFDTKMSKLVFRRLSFLDLLVVSWKRKRQAWHETNDMVSEAGILET